MSLLLLLSRRPPLVFTDGGGIASAEAVGTGLFVARFDGDGVPSTEAFGAGEVVTAGGEAEPVEGSGGAFLPRSLPTRRPRRRPPPPRPRVLASRGGIASAEAFGRGAVEHHPNEQAEAEEDAAALLLLGEYA